MSERNITHSVAGRWTEYPYDLLDRGQVVGAVLARHSAEARARLLRGEVVPRRGCEERAARASLGPIRVVERTDPELLDVRAWLAAA